MVVAKLERSVKVVRFCIEPPNLPAIIGAAVAVGMIKHMSIPCANIGLWVKVMSAKYTTRLSDSCTPRTTQCQRCKRKSSGFTLQNVKNNIKKISHGKIGLSVRSHL